MQNPLRLLIRALWLVVRGRAEFDHEIEDVAMLDADERFRAFRRVAVSPPRGAPSHAGAVFQVRFGFKNLSVAANRRLSLIPIPLIVAQPGFRSKTWYLGQNTGDFIGRYEFETVEAANAYVCSLPLKMMRRRAMPGSLRWHVTPQP